MPYKFYRVRTIPCPNCANCEAHSHRTPRMHVGKRYYVKNNDGTETEMTEEEWHAWAES